MDHSLLNEIRGNSISLDRVDLNSRCRNPQDLLALCEALKTNTSVKDISLCFNRIGEAGAEALANMLKFNRGIVKIDLGSNQVGDRGALALAQSLKENSIINKIGLKNNEITENGCLALANAFKEHKYVQTVWLNGNLVGDNGAVALAEALDYNKSIEVIDLSDNKIEVKGARALAHALTTNTKVMVIDLRSNDIGDDGTVALAESLKSNKAIKEIGLRYNGIGDDGAKALAGALEVNKSIEKISLRCNVIGDEGAIALAAALKVNKSLTGIHIRDNEIEQAGGIALAEALEVNESVATINLSDNRIGGSGAVAIASALLVNKSIKDIDLSNNQIDKDGCTALAEALKFNDSVQRIYLGHNLLGDFEAMKLAESLMINSIVQTVDLRENQIEDRGAKALAEALKANSSVLKVILSENLIKDAGVLALALAVMANNRIEAIDLSDNAIEGAGAKALVGTLMNVKYSVKGVDGCMNVMEAATLALAKTLRLNTHIRYIDANHYQMGDAGAQALAEALKINSKVVVLCLGANNIGPTGAIALADALKVNIRIKELRFCNNCIADSGVLAIASALKVNNSISIIDLSQNNFGNEGAIALAESLKLNYGVQLLLLQENQIGDSGTIALVESLKINGSIHTINLCDNDFGDAGAIALAELTIVKCTVDVLVGKEYSDIIQNAQVLCDSALTPVHASVVNCHVHICGEGNSGKSVLHHWIHELTSPSIWNDWFGPSCHYIAQGEERATRGFVRSQRTYIHQDTALHFSLYDYGGQNEFKINHSCALSVPDSIYVAVVPLYDMENNVWFDENECRFRLLDWLKFIYSVMHTRKINWDNLVPSFTLNGADEDHKDIQQTTSELDQSSAELEEEDIFSSQTIPILIVVNKFSQKRWNQKPTEDHLAYLTDERLHDVVVDWIAQYFEIFNNIMLNSEDYGNSIYDQNKVVFNFLPPILMDVCQRYDVKSKLLSSLIDASKSVAKTRYTLPSCVEHVRSHCIPRRVDYKILPTEAYVAYLRNTFESYPPVNDFIRSQGEEKSAAAVDYLVRCALPLLETTGVILRLQSSSANQLVTPTKFSTKEWIVTDRNWLTSSVIGKILQSASKSGRQCDLMISRDKVEGWLKGLIPQNVSIIHLLHSLSLAIPVRQDRITSKILPIIGEEDGEASHEGKVTLGDYQFLLLGLITESMPDLDFLLRSGEIVRCSGKRLCRVFALRDSRYKFVPGFFMRLFVFIHNRYPFKETHHSYWSNGMVLRFKRMAMSTSSSSGDRKPFAVTVQLVVSPYELDEGGFIKQAFLVDCGLSLDLDMEAGYVLEDVVYDEMNAIRDYLHRHSWNLEWQEYCLNADRKARLLRELEQIWFLSTNDNDRLNISSVLLGDDLPIDGSWQRKALSLSWQAVDQRGLLYVSSRMKSVRAIRDEIDRHMHSSDSSRLELLAVVLDVCRHNRIAVTWRDLHADDREVEAQESLDEDKAQKSLEKSDDNFELPVVEQEDSVPVVHEELLSHVLTIKNDTSEIRRIQEENRRAEVNRQRFIYSKPLLMVLRKRSPTSRAARIKQKVKESLRIKVFSVHFLCEVCGRCKPKDPIGGSELSGYKLEVWSEFAQRVAKAAYVSLCMLQIVLVAFGIPNGVSQLAKLCIDSIATVSDILPAELESRHQELQAMRKLCAQGSEAVSECAGGDDYLDKSSGEASGLKYAAVSEESMQGTTAIKEYGVTSQHIETIKMLFDDKWKDENCTQSGLEIAKKDDLQMAWVCAGDGRFSKSDCYTKFMEKGKDCLHVHIKYV